MGENKVSIMDLLLFLLQNPTLHSQATTSAHDSAYLILQLLSSVDSENWIVTYSADSDRMTIFDTVPEL